MVVVKPPNLLSQGDQTGDDDLHSLLKEYIREKYNKPGNVYLALCIAEQAHRGVMVFAKTSRRLGACPSNCGTTPSSGVANHRFGYPEPLQGERRDYLLKDNRTNMVSVVKPNVAGAQEAILKYQVLDMKNGFSLVRVQLLTGRPHQIRVQMAAFGHPVLGDQRYGPRTNVRQQLALWAERISLVHPTKKSGWSFPNRPERNRGPIFVCPDRIDQGLFLVRTSAL